MNTIFNHFSVLMSLYQHERPEYLSECLQSLAQQTRQANEIIIVFDGYIPPELEKVVLNFQVILPIKIVKLAENMGLGQALNFGLNHCSNEIIFRMDSDDIALPQRFEWQMNFFQQNPDIQLLGGQIAEFKEHLTSSHATRRVPEHLSEIRLFAKKRNPFNHMTVGFYRSAVRAVGGYQHHDLMEDYHLWLRMLQYGIGMANLAETLVYARTGSAMLQRRRGWRYIRSEWQLFHLKKELKFQSTWTAFYCFLIRSIPRLLPQKLLYYIYKLLR